MKARRPAAATAAAALLCSLVAVAGATPAYAADCPTVDAVTHQLSTPLLSQTTYTGCDLTGADLRGIDVSHLVLSQVVLDGADLSGAVLTTSSLTGSFRAASFEGATIAGTTLSGDFRDALFQGASLNPALGYGAGLGGNLDGADLRGVDARGLSLSGQGAVLLDSAILADATLYLMDLTGAHLSGTDLTGAVLQTVDLTGADLSGAILTGAEVLGSKLGGVDLTTASMRGLRTWSIYGIPVLPSDWMLVDGRLVGPGADLSGQPFYTGSLANAHLADADLTGASFSVVSMAGADLTRARIVGATFAVDLTGATGLGTAIYNSSTQWIGSTCPDGRSAMTHVGMACTSPHDSTPPTATIVSPGPFVWPTGSTAALTVDVSDDSTPSYALQYRLRWRTSTSGAATASWTSWKTAPDWWTPTSGPAPLPVSPGKRTCVQVLAVDIAGNSSGWRGDRCFDVPYEPSFWDQKPSYWSGRQDQGWSNFLHVFTKRKGDSVSFASTRYVRQIGVVATTCPTCGSVAIYVGSTKVGSLSLARATTTKRQLLLLPRLSSRLHGPLKVVVTSTSGRLVRLDDVAVTGV